MLLNLGESIKYWRTQKNMTQKQLADLSGISEISIRKYENNERSPKIGTLSKIAKSLGVTLIDLDAERYFAKDRQQTDLLINDLYNFIDDVSDMDISEDAKHENIEEAKRLLKDAHKLAALIDSAKESHIEMKNIMGEQKIIKEDIKKCQLEIDAMFLSTLHQLNSNGQTKAIEQLKLLTKIPEYRKDE